jgi:CRP/FNR family transcriptional regulator/CRP/FNR family cyclic AMP-dependent transcriptional regulator
METALAVTQAKYWHLRQLSLFATLPDWQLRQLVKISDLRLFKRGEEVYRAGDLSSSLYVLRTGKVKLSRESAGKRVVLGFPGPGEMFGETAVTGQVTREDDATVIEDAFVCIIDRDRFASLVEQSPGLALHITGVVSRRKARVERRLLDLLTLDVRTRLARALVDLVDRFGVEDEGAAMIDLRLTQTDLGQLVGSTRETTSMAFNAFRRSGWVRSKDRQIWVTDRDALAAV